MAKKLCFRCERVKNIELFSFDRRHPDGKNITCKKCVAKRTKELVEEKKANGTYINPYVPKVGKVHPRVIKMMNRQKIRQRFKDWVINGGEFI